MMLRFQGHYTTVVQTPVDSDLLTLVLYKGIKHKKEGGYMEKVIEVKNLYKLYRVGDEVVRALDGVDFNIYKGEFCEIGRASCRERV